MIEIVKGNYSMTEVSAHRVQPGVAARESDEVNVWKLEEKQSDVSLALHLYDDAVRNGIGQVVLVTNDTDQAPTLRMLRDNTQTIVGLVTPASNARRSNKTLIELAHWHVSLEDFDLALCQLPAHIRSPSNPDKVFNKPFSWYPNSAALESIFDTVKIHRRGAAAAWRWLETPNDYFDGCAPIEFAIDETRQALVWQYIEKYCDDQGL